MDGKVRKQMTLRVRRKEWKGAKVREEGEKEDR